MIDDTTPTEEVLEEVTEDTTANVVDSTEVPASLTVQDLANLRNIIDVASQRGAFKTTEFTVVGATYSKLSNFINAIAPKEEASSEATEEEAVEAAGE